MYKLVSTSEVIANSLYCSTPTKFFANFSDAWNITQGQVLKLETRQIYKEPGNPSYDAMDKGNFSEALQLLPKVRSEDISLYQSLSNKNVDFIRCRPIIKPITRYIQWELECYKFNSIYGERIYFLDQSPIFDELALHDFMTFDRKIAFVHDYDEFGEIKGGWIINETWKINALICLFSIIKADAVYYQNYPLEKL